MREGNKMAFPVSVMSLGLAVNLLKSFVAYACNDFGLCCCFSSTRVSAILQNEVLISEDDHSC